MADDGQSPAGTGATEGAGPQYLGIGCFTAIAGFAGGGMIAVLIAKIVGAATKCAAEVGNGRAVQLVHVLVFRGNCRCGGASRSGNLAVSTRAPAREQLGTRVMRWHV